MQPSSTPTTQNRVVNTIIAIALVLFASLIAPKLPRNITKYLENPILKFVIFASIAFLATRDLVTAVIATIAVLVSYQTLAVQQITDKVMNKTKDMLAAYNLTSQDSVMPIIDLSDIGLVSNSSEPDVSNSSEQYVSNSSEPIVMSIGNNDVPPSSLAVNNYEIKNTIKYLKGDTSELPLNYDESDQNAGMIEDSVTLTESCSMKHTQNYSCSNIPKMDVNNLSGYEEDFVEQAPVTI